MQVFSPGDKVIATFLYPGTTEPLPHKGTIKEKIGESDSYMVAFDGGLVIRLGVSHLMHDA